MANTGGVSRVHHTSNPEKLTFALLHGGIILFATWLVYGGFTWSDPLRAKLLLACALLYWLRHCFTLFVLLKRRVAYSEVFGLLVFMAVFELGFLILGAGIMSETAKPLGAWDGVAIALVVLGSVLNTGSEWQRHVWKKKPSSKGHCYTGGLFRHSLHINYFGDTLLFTGWAILSASIFGWAIPAFVTAGFIFFHIPALDTYLSERYGEEFDQYAARTAKFIPYIY